MYKKPRSGQEITTFINRRNNGRQVNDALAAALSASAVGNKQEDAVDPRGGQIKRSHILEDLSEQISPEFHKFLIDIYGREPSEVRQIFNALKL
ncbi:21939_t:CDS:2, partial [Racocetra persica]